LAKSHNEATPLMKQYNAIKVKYPGALLLFRVGDFYETFGEDAVTASKILGITLTKRGNGSASEIALAGFPHHSLDNYLPKLVRAGQRVAVCDQLEDPKMVKGIVKRGVTELVTPGVTFNDNVLNQRQNNYLCAIHYQNKDLSGIAILDISTGDFLTAQGSWPYIDKLVQSFNPSEILFNKARKKDVMALLGERWTVFAQEDWLYQFDFAHEKLTKHFGTQNLKGFGVDSQKEGIVAAGAILQYLSDTEHNEIAHITSLSRIEEERYVWLDKFTIRNLELLFPQFEGGVPLIDILDDTQTPMGARRLKNWLVLPLKEPAAIKERGDLVEVFYQDSLLAESVLGHLKQVGDLERLASKIAVRRVNPRELNQLRKSLAHVQPLQATLQQTGNKALKAFADKLNPLSSLVEKLETTLQAEVPMLLSQGGIIAEGVNSELDELRNIAYSGKDYLLQVQQREIVRTGITSLKISFNRVFGYYIEVTNTHKDKVPADWIRKQTTTNAERYITEELKKYEDTILGAEEKILALEQRLFAELVTYSADFVPQIQQNARGIAQLDCLLSFATVAIKNNYVRPEVNDTVIIDIKEGRHPVIEKQLPVGESYVPNDIFLDNAAQQVMIITGPNMAGKSALLRQTALITLMAQMGSFVPATAAKIGYVDKVFTRVGASDNLSKGESTFMVEMTETASILNNFSDRSLILMDEIGRGTSTYDGISIAWAIVEFLHQNSKFHPRTLFATHYHELNQLAIDFPRVKNFNVSVKEVGDKVIFMRKLKEGGSEHSFGIHVAQIAGIPNPVILRAHQIMQHLEKEKVSDTATKKMADLPKNNYQLNIFEANDPGYVKVKELLENTDINTISPVEALLKLNEMKGWLGKR
jgi:DNA mismatch repair protein MutS